MPKVILDTNVFVSALVFGGKVSKVLDLVFDDSIHLVCCEELEKEIMRILITKFDVSMSNLQIVQDLLSVGVYYTIQKPYPHISRDVNDNYLLSLINASRADVLVTGDKDLLTLESYNNCPIIKVSEFLEKIDIDR